ncbi:hypothetical protein J7J55_01860 [Candidatus Bipolaricaulota bacterium]|nr:hypothetical protein [Candidatus Bipolaricaulota bacterium]
MMNGRMVGLVLGLGILILGAAAFGYDRSEFMFLNEIRPGMTGIGKTVVANDVISEFNVDVLGVIDEPGTKNDFIVVRVSGEAIGRAGGIAQGMSGSPIYIDGRLIGALSRAAEWSKALTPIGLVTPIETMLPVLDEVSSPAPSAVLPGVRVVEHAGPPAPTAVAAAPDTIFAWPVATPLLVSGLSGRALSALMDGPGSEPEGLIDSFLPENLDRDRRGLSAYNLRLNPFSGGTTAPGQGTSPLSPGGGIGVALASGDVTIGALGTITYRDGDALIGFGHPFLSNGASDFPLTTVHIYDTIKAYDASFKIGTLGETAGAVTADRMTAIGGRLGRSAHLVDLSLGVHDTDENTTSSFRIDLVDEPRIMWYLILASGLEAIDSSLDRVGQGTVEVNYQILGDGMPKPLERHDLFLSTQDVAIYPPWQLANIVDFLNYNDFQDPQITRIAASMQVTKGLKAIHINHLELDSDSYSPGDTIHYTVELQTYQGETKTVNGEIEIPEDLDAYSVDYITVRAYGGPRELESGENPREFHSLEELIDAVEDLPSYDTLTVELFAPDPYSPYLDALQGIDKVRQNFTGYFLYDSREVQAYLYPAEERSEEEETTEVPGKGK